MKRGFTLIELMVAIAIITLISSLVLGSLNQSRARARDNRRVTDLKLIQSALELYANSENPDHYPGSNGYPYPVRSGADTIGVVGIYSKTNVFWLKYMSTPPVDPGDKSPYIYYAPGCIVAGTSPGATKIFSYSGPIDASSISDLPAKCTAINPAAGWVPYALAAKLEIGLGNNTANDIVPLDTKMVVYSVKSPAK